MISSSSRLGGEAGRGERGHDHQRQRAVLELHRRDVDGDPDMVGPGRRRPRQAVAQHPFAELADQAGLLGDRDELRPARSCRASGWRQRSSASQPLMRSSCRWRQRLVVQLEPRLAPAMAWRRPYLELPRRAQLGVHARLEEAIGAAAVALGARTAPGRRSSGAGRASVPSVAAPARCRCWCRS